MAEIKRVGEFCLRSKELRELILKLLMEHDYGWVEEGNHDISPFRIEVYERVDR